MKFKTNQSGAAHLVAILTVIIVVAIGTIGWRVWDNNNQNAKQDKTTNITSVPYLEIAELGVKLKLTQSTKDMTYHINSSGDAVLSSTSLAKEEPKCAADYAGNNGVGMVSSFTNPEDQLPNGSGTNASTFPDAVKVGDKYYFIVTGQQFCVNAGTKNGPTDTAYKIESTLVRALRNDITLEKQ